MNNKKLFVIDLDGTALLNFTTLHPQTIKGVNHLKALGHEVVIATGRIQCACINFYKQLELTSPLICSNGAQLVNPTDESFVGWSKEVDEELVNYILSDDVYPLLENIYYHVDGNLLANTYNELLLEHLEQTGCKTGVKSLKDSSNITSIALISMNENVEKVRATIKEKFPSQEFNSWDGNYHESYIEVNANNSNKWIAVEEVAKQLNIKSENIFTFGDAMNDYEMIKNCENGIAMGNSAHKLQAVASVVLTETNEEGAVGNYMLSIKE